MAFKIFVGVILVFAVGNLIFFMSNSMQYHLKLRTLRKALYTLFIGALSFGIITGETDITNWEFILTLMGVVVFIDLSLLLTPSIMKIWNTEFQYSDYVENVIVKNEKIQKGTMRRVGTLSEMIQGAGHYFSGLPLAESEAEQRQQLENYLGEYASQYGFSVQIWDIVYEAPGLTQDEESAGREESDLSPEELAYFESLKDVLNRIERLNSFDIDNERDAYLESLFQSEIISVIKENSMIIPVFMNERTMLVVLKNDKGELLEVDAVHITNLIYLFYSFY
ncbi:type II toxin-antitoxin system SpoIISA family toxin [Rossellomorea vietnamensis]|uniref:type II toxin-antitoxin system SpoIISA family toxin n=1 Tax=Rossellomorea TaxID=2837508 RepID=UPI001653B754|nr:type II toxin-antitoxin system SpoIISA family toxin [Rossellomorea aquimaris]